MSTMAAFWNEWTSHDGKPFLSVPGNLLLMLNIDCTVKTMVLWQHQKAVSSVCACRTPCEWCQIP